MRIIKSLSVLAAPLFFGVFAFGSSTAQAAPCCSAPMCQTDPPHPWCALCDEDCSDDEAEISLIEDPAYDEVEAVCRYVAEATPSPAENPAPAPESVRR
ncbi:hypothetical protein SAMN02745121_07437 [Nannocystis exedens]|uniref:Secreted protein n=1 Tax=Nannocystis exedens TaxID=54 RepID=A0A1I2GR82_9BACT|nr:hypothetical protein [Nannocystis exedens]PCC68740.1 hypothetical protein NAEX_01757 [Nannocystis exedens]SFF19509.1 hypothetical protein SAMN02745121_07437 [Nannocystis exedens]